MNAEPQPKNTTVNFDGENSGQMVVGDHNVQVHAEAGAMVYVAQQGNLEPHPSDSPVLLKPDRGDELIGREEVVEEAKLMLADSEPFLVYGDRKIGKTTIIKHLYFLFEKDLAEQGNSQLADGCVYVSQSENQHLDDLLVEIFDAFHEPLIVGENVVAYRPSKSHFRKFMGSKRALIIIDNVQLSGSDTKALLEALPECTLLLAGDQPVLQNEDQMFEIAGLPEESSVQLFAKRLKRELQDDEREAVAKLCRLLAGSPQDIRNAATRFRRGKTLAELTQEASGPQPLAESATESTSEPLVPPPATSTELTPTERNAAVAAAAVNGVIASPELLTSPAARTTSDGVPGEANENSGGATELEESAYAYHGSGYKVDDALLQELSRTDPDAIEACRERLLDHFIDWAQQHQDDDQLLVDSDPMLEILKWSADTGKWQKTIDLGMLIERQVMLSGNWGDWRVVLDAILVAARGIGDPKREAWALHQRGTLKFARHEKRSHNAAADLDQARKIREKLDDPLAMAISEHNFRIARPWYWRLMRRGFWILLGFIIGSLLTLFALYHEDHEIEISHPDMLGGTTRTATVRLKTALDEPVTFKIDPQPGLIKLVDRDDHKLTIDAGETSAEFAFEAAQPTSNDLVPCSFIVTQVPNVGASLRTFIIPARVVFNVKRSNPGPDESTLVKSVSFFRSDDLETSIKKVIGGELVVCRVEFDQPLRVSEPAINISPRPEWLVESAGDVTANSLRLDDRVIELKLQTLPVDSDLELSVSVEGGEIDGRLEVFAPKIESIDLPERLVSGNIVNATVKLDGKAPASGTTFRFAAEMMNVASVHPFGDGIIPVAIHQTPAQTSQLIFRPATVTIKPGERSVPFEILCPHVGTDVQFRIVAVSNHANFESAVKIEPAALHAFSVTQDSIVDGGVVEAVVEAVVELDGTAPEGGATVAIKYSADAKLLSALAESTHTITIPVGERRSSVSLALPRLCLEQQTTVAISASMVTRQSVPSAMPSTDTIEVKPRLVALGDLTFETDRIQGGSMLRGALDLKRNGSEDSAEISLAVKTEGGEPITEEQFAELAGFGNFAANESHNQIQLRLDHVDEPVDLLFTATDGPCTTIVRKVHVEPEALATLELARPTVKAGEAIECIVSLREPSTRELMIRRVLEYLPSSREGATRVRKELTPLRVSANEPSVTFRVGTSTKITEATDLSISLSLFGSKLHETARVLPYEPLPQPSLHHLDRIVLSTKYVACGGRLRGQIILNRRAGSEPITVHLNSSHPGNVLMPTQVVIAAGQQSTQFDIVTTAGRDPSTVRIVASLRDEKNTASFRLDACPGQSCQPSYYGRSFRRRW